MKNPDLLIVTPHLNNRLDYVLRYIFEQRMNLRFQVIHNPYIERFPYPTLFYGFNTDRFDVISIPCSGYLDLPAEKLFLPSVDKVDGMPVFFAYHKSFSYPFDIFSAVFFMLARIEELLSNQTDVHGRFDACQSLLYPYQLHHRALVDEWILDFSSFLFSQFPDLPIKTEKSKFHITIDIDQIFYFRGKSLLRNIGGTWRDFFQGNKEKVKERWQVLRGKKQDPLDLYEKMRDLVPMAFQPLHTFILASPQRTIYDKNTSFKTKHEKRVLDKIKIFSTLGWHSSYFSQENLEKFIAEKKQLEKIIKQPVTTHRSHYLRLHIPKTYQFLVECGITDDYTMGFACDYGFRAGTGKPFPFYDITQDKVLPLTVHPFCVMDGTLVDYLKLSLEENKEVFKNLWNYVRTINSDMCILLHNETFSEQGRWEGWSNMLVNFFKYVEAAYETFTP